MYQQMTKEELLEIAPEHIAVSLSAPTYRVCSFSEYTDYKTMQEELRDYKVFANIKRRRFTYDGNVYYIYPEE